MDCMEAQRLMQPYLDNKLTDKELAGFIDHLDHCPDCLEELEINMAVNAVMSDKVDLRDKYAYDFKHKASEKIAASRRFLRVARTERFLRRIVIVIAEIIFALTILTSIQLRKFQDHTFTTLYRFFHRHDPVVEKESEFPPEELTETGFRETAAEEPGQAAGGETAGSSAAENYAAGSRAQQDTSAADGR